MLKVKGVGFTVDISQSVEDMGEGLGLTPIGNQRLEIRLYGADGSEFVLVGELHRSGSRFMPNFHGVTVHDPGVVGVIRSLTATREPQDVMP